MPEPKDFALIIGAGKAGTTSLFSYLSQHPEICAANRKEVNFFSRHWDRGLDFYLGHWDWRPGRHRLALEASPGYSNAAVSPGVPGRIAALHGRSFRFIYILRHPLARMPSHAQQIYFVSRRNNETVVPFAWTDDLFERVLTSSLYAMQLDAYTAHFDRKDILILIAEDLRRDADAVLDRTRRFLGLSPFAFDTSQSFNESGKRHLDNPAWSFLQGIKPIERVATTLLPRSLRQRIRYAVSPKATGDFGLTEAQRRQAEARIIPDLIRLRDDYGVDVERAWNIGLTTAAAS